RTQKKQRAATLLKPEGPRAASWSTSLSKAVKLCVRVHHQLPTTNNEERPANPFTNSPLLLQPHQVVRQKSVGHGDVERFHLALHGDADRDVGLIDQVRAHAAALAAEQQGDLAAQLGLVEGDLGV